MNGTADDITPFENELIGLIRRTCEQPALLEPGDLDPLKRMVGASALDYALVTVSFHFINRISDMLGIVTEFLPVSLRRFEFLRRWSVRMMGLFMSSMDLSNREYGMTYEQTVDRISTSFERSTGRPIGNEFESLQERPQLIEAIQLVLEERDERSGLDQAVMATVHRTVENALPRSPEDVSGVHSRPGNPIEDFAFVGTRYAYRTTKAMIEDLRSAGFDDLSILDLATSVADANQWARLHRLLGLPPEIFYLH